MFEVGEYFLNSVGIFHLPPNLTLLQWQSESSTKSTILISFLMVSDVVYSAVKDKLTIYLI